MDETKVLAKELRKHERGRGKRYPKELEARVRACIAARRARGDSLEGIATDLGMIYETVLRAERQARFETRHVPEPARSAPPSRGSERPGVRVACD